MADTTSIPSPTAPSTADVVIIGGSVVGSSAAWHLLDGGFGGRVVVIERDPTYVRASAHRAMGGIRQQFCTPVTVQMVQYSVELWKTFDRRFAIDGRTPRAWFRQRGYVFLADAATAPALTKRYELERERRQVLALSDVSLSVSDGEFMAIVGPSGCGKTSLLNIVAGLLRYDGGEVVIDGRKITGPGVDRAVVFQQASLLPWRTVAGNVRYGMEMQRRFDGATMQSRTEQFVRLVGLSGFERHYPSELSGGMQQRVNLARALAADPMVMLMDEPFAALDAQTREYMQAELLKIWSEAKKTVLFITHQINEAVFLADRVAVMSARPGRVKGIVTIPFPRPRSLAVKRDPKFLEIEETIWQMVEETPERIGMTKAAG
jgi:NitT/TauT family transport system ATP-binding protein